MNQAEDVFLSLGANLDGPCSNLKRAVRMLGEIDGLALRGVSPFYRTSPVDYHDQPDFVNAAAWVESRIEPEVLHNCLKHIEESIGTGKTFRDGPRRIDLDLIFFGDRVIENGPDLVVPHPKMQARRFVLVPLSNLCPDFVHPVFNETVRRLLDQCVPADGEYVVPIEPDGEA
jgi:2-amino-4-hydroxy-6-hydroxymethyldihydropteridine diphosphokinase